MSKRRRIMRRACISMTLVALLACSPIAAGADVVLDWNAIAVSTLLSQGWRDCDGPGGSRENDRAAPRRRLVPPAVPPARVDRPGRVAAHARLPRRRRSRVSVAKHHTVWCAERSRQPGLDRAVCPGC